MGAIECWGIYFYPTRDNIIIVSGPIGTLISISIIVISLSLIMISMSLVVNIPIRSIVAFF